MKIIVVNKKANFNFHLFDCYECGIELKGTEVKSIQNHDVSINEAYIYFKKNEAYIMNMHIAPYKQGNIFNVDPLRTRKLLLHRHEINKLQLLAKKESYTFIPTKVYWKKNKLKVSVCLAKGKKNFDKRLDIKKRDMDRAIKKTF